MKKTVAVLSALIRPLLEPRLPDWVDARYFASTDQLFDLAPEAEIGWFDLFKKDDMAEAIRRATNLKWLNTIYAGVDGMPLDLLAKRGALFTYGAGINAIAVAEYIMMGMLTVAKGYRDVVHGQGRHEWLQDSPGKVELFGSKALILGYGAIGKLVEERLKPFGVDVTAVRRSPGPGTLTPNAWQARLGEFDWIIVAVPATPDTEKLISTAELAAMKPSAVLLNFARGEVIDQDALIAALQKKSLSAAFLDVATPEPLPADHILWTLPNAHISMHLSGKSQTKMFLRGTERFLQNLARYQAGEPLLHQVDLARGY